jgi:hypothetical protein
MGGFLTNIFAQRESDKKLLRLKLESWIACTQLQY